MNTIIENKINKILNISFNQDSSCFSIGIENGFMVYGTYPIKNQYERKMDGGIKQAEMLYRTNLLALIGGGDIPKFNPKKLVLWDDYQNKMVSEIKFFSNLKNVKLKKDKIFAICDKTIYVFDFKTLENLEIINTKENPKGLFGINNDENSTIIAYLEKNDKENKENINKNYITVKNYTKGNSLKIFAQEDTISYIALNNDGSLLATSNEKGTLIKLHSCINGNLLAQFYRGKDKAEINYICFDKLSNFLAVTSDRGTIHIWSLGGVIEKLKEIGGDEKIEDKKIEDHENKINDERETEKDINLENLPRNKKVMFSQNEKSFAQIRINSNKSICSFQKNNIIVAISYDGMYYQAQLDTKNGGNCKIIFQDSLNNLIQEN
jgi:WD40 repeat protein